MTNASSDPVRDEVRSYYRTVHRYIERELLGRDDRTFWADRAREAPGGAVLELGCGTGRVTEVLAEEARIVVGVDLSPEMLRRARRRLSARSGAHLVLGDMRTVRLSRRFGLVAAANDPFAHLVEDRDRTRALETVARHLEPSGGCFVLDAHWLGPERLERAASGDGFQRERAVDAPGADLRIREQWRRQGETRRCLVRYEYLEDGERVDRASFQARLWSVDELHRKLERAGLRVRTLLGGYDGSGFDPDASSHLVVVAEAGRALRDAGARP